MAAENEGTTESELARLGLELPDYEEQKFKSSLIDVKVGWDCAVGQMCEGVVEPLLEHIRDLELQLLDANQRNS